MAEAMLRLPRELTLRQARATLARLEAGIQAGGARVLLDASPLQSFDSAAISVLLACQRKAAAVRKTLLLRGLPPSLRALAVLYGVDELLQTP